MVQELMRDREVRFSPLVSILIVNWNGRAHIEACLRSCLNLRYSNREIIVVDNNSSDGSPEIVKNQFPKVQLVRLRQNLGFGRACNIAIGFASGAYIAILACDRIVDSMWLSYLVEAMKDSGGPSNSRIGIAGGIQYYSHPEDVIWGGIGKIDLTTGSAWEVHAFRRSARSTIDFDCIDAGAVLIRREVFERIGIFDEGYFLYAEDRDFSMRALRAGYLLRFVPEAKSWHLMSIGDRRAFSLRSYYFGAYSKIRLCFKHFPLPYLFSAILFQLLVKPCFECFWFRQNPICFSLSISAMCKNLLNLRETFVTRSKVQALGKCKAKSRVRELVMIAIARLSKKQYYRW